MVSFQPSPVPEDTYGWSSRGAGAVLSAAFTWLREKLWAPPVVADPKRNHGPAGRLCRHRHGDKTRDSAVKRWWQTHPSHRGHERGLPTVALARGSWFTMDLKITRTVCIWMLLLQRGTWTYMGAPAHWCKGSHSFESCTVLAFIPIADAGFSGFCEPFSALYAVNTRVQPSVSAPVRKLTRQETYNL